MVERDPHDVDEHVQRTADPSSGDLEGGTLAWQAPVGTPTQDGPVKDQSDVSDEDRIAGIVAQTHDEVGDAGLEQIAEALRQRFADAGLDVDADRTVALAAEIDQR